jgi:hypothetical protein
MRMLADNRLGNRRRSVDQSGYVLNDQRIKIWIPAGAEFFLFLKEPEPTLEPTRSPSQVQTGRYVTITRTVPVVQWLKNTLSYTPDPPPPHSSLNKMLYFDFNWSCRR